MHAGWRLACCWLGWTRLHRNRYAYCDGYNGGMYSRNSEPFKLERDCAAVLVPQGEQVTLPAGSIGYISQALGGIPLSGFFTCGEIGPTRRGNLAFYNLTAILVLLREVDA